ncbi:hypothetical protein IMSHALPRED_004823 [Imshaugia aleurites]|uniref:Nucleotide exchange factor SIL1 n=1 Tax=Imshaugia aleurites TaxID=172621 RepID=A0A8H3FCH3_9LECA|nr:hypothetical protein IMSHALPRED_004823 [Imshaugia aleurites]
MFKRIRLSVLLSFFLLSQAHASAPASSPPASTELICHTAHASECYPAIFQPTEHFQRIHDDQSIPPGLHVRMNLATGLKEARLNVPEPPGAPHADLVVIDDLPPPNPSTEEHDLAAEASELRDQSDPEGHEQRGRYYPAAFDAEESSLFHSSVATLHSTAALSTADLPALAALQDLAHSIHWGVALARDAAVGQRLVSAIDPGSAAAADVRSAATLLLGTAVHSNPDALNALLSHSYSSEAGTAPVGNALAALRDAEQGDVVLQTRTVFLLSQLCQNVEQLRVFIHSEGLDTLFDLFESEEMTLDDGKDRFRAKVANFIYDRILSSIGSANGLVSQSGSDSFGLGDEQALVKGLEPWCNALAKALRLYAPVSMDAEDSSPAADAAYESIKETNQALREKYARLRICGDESEL